MTSLFEKIDDDFMAELWEMSENLNTKKRTKKNKTLEEAEKWKTDRKKSK